MMSYLILFALIGLICYYSYLAYKTIKSYIDKKRFEKNSSRSAASEIELASHGVNTNNEQTHE